MSKTGGSMDIRSAYFLLIITVINTRAITRTRVIEFKRAPSVYPVLEGETVQMVCTTTDITLMTINRNEPYFLFYVKDSEVTGNLPDYYSYTDNVTSGILTIDKITKNDNGSFRCPFPYPKGLTVNVLHMPLNKFPVCTSNHQLSNLTAESLLIFNCTVGEGNPPVNASAFMHNENGTYDVSDYAELVTHVHQNSSLTYSFFFNQSLFPEGRLECKVSQDLPSPYSHLSYRRSCSIGAKPYFSVLIISNNTITNKVKVPKGVNVSLTCISNVSGVQLEWTDIPNDWIPYSSTDRNMSIGLTINYNGSEADASLAVNCTGAYRGAKLSNATIIYAESVKTTLETPTSGSSPIQQFGLPICLAVIGLGVLVMIICIIIVIRFRKKKAKPANNVYTLSPVANSSENNANDTTLSEANTQNKSNVDCYNGSDHEIVHNPAYGSYQEDQQETKRHSNPETTSNLGDMNGMVDNIVYESAGRQSTSTGNAMESPYDVI